MIRKRGRRPMKIVAMAAFAAMAHTGLSAQAGKADRDSAAVMDSIDGAALEAALADLGAKARRLDEEGRVMRVAYRDGAIAVMRLSACEQGPCRGLLMTSLFAPPEGKEPEQARRIARRFSTSFNPATVIVNTRGEHLLKAYVVLDRGITRGNLAVNLGLFGLGIEQYREALYSAAD